VRDADRHEAPVDAWFKRGGGHASSKALLQRFEAAFAALWARTSTTLGEVTLTAIAERVLCSASEKYPLLAPLAVEPSGGINAAELRARIKSVRASELKEAVRFVLVEYLTVLGNLTAEILTPELHEELAHVAVTDSKDTVS
jgi:hypothetical protein